VHIGCQIRHARALRPVAAPQDRWRTRRRRCPPRPRLVRATLVRCSAVREGSLLARAASTTMRRSASCAASRTLESSRAPASVSSGMVVLPSVHSLDVGVRLPQPCVAMADGYHGLPTGGVAGEPDGRDRSDSTKPCECLTNPTTDCGFPRLTERVHNTSLTIIGQRRSRTRAVARGWRRRYGGPT